MTIKKEIRFIVDQDFHSSIQAVMALESISLAELCRRSLNEYVEERFSDKVASKTQALIRSELDRKFEKLRDGLGTLISKNIIASATSMYLQYAIIQNQHGDIERLKEEITPKAIAYLKQKRSYENE